ncbi:MAG TPA: putative Ig domain-containing protein [Acidobacteriota bacterium]|nr:putative Ig domain-containing protein [Acidobacteriota bacterium]HNT17898.1 putative Ig domain-containing protein [Acidobacteriota bacterium]
MFKGSLKLALSMIFCSLMMVLLIPLTVSSGTPEAEDCFASDVVVPSGEIKDPNPPSNLTGGGSPRATGGPDAFGYTYTDSNEAGGPAFSWVDITGTGTLVGGWTSKDDGYAGPFNLGQTFLFYGTPYTQFYAGSNGFLSFGAGSSSLSNQCPLPSTTTPNDLIALLWDDLNLNTSGDAYYQYFPSCPVGSGPCTVIEYANIAHYGGAAGSAGTWEAFLYGSGNILLQFQDAGTEAGSSSTTGIEDSTGTTGLGYACNSAGSLANSLAILYSLPAVGVGVTDGHGCAGETVSYTVTVVNRTGATATFDLTYSGYVWPVSGPATVGPLADAVSVDITVTHTIDPMAADGATDSFTVTATDQSNPANTGSDTATTTAGSVWSALPDMASGKSRPAGASVNGLFYVIGGESQDGITQIYDPATNLWTTLPATMPSPASNLTAAELGTDIYVPGGYTGATYLDTLQILDTTAGTWSTVATDPMPAARSGAACEFLGGTLFVFGGVDSSVVYSAATYAYDPAAPAGSRWTVRTPMPAAGAYGDAVAVNGLIYVMGMRDASIADPTAVYAYDPTADTWTTYPALTTGRGGAKAWRNGTDLWVGGGGWGSYLNSVEVYDTTLGPAGTWTAGPELITGRRTFASATDDANGRLFAGAGWNGTYLAAAEIYLPCSASGCSITIAPATLPAATVGVAYSQTLTASGGTAPYTFEVTSGVLPAGLTLNPTTGVISGTPTTGGTYTFTITATDSTACTGTITYTMDFSYGWNMSVVDDAGRASACLNTDTGYYAWTALTGFGAGTYVGRSNVTFAYNCYYFQSPTPSGMNMKINMTTNKASGSFMTPPLRERSICIDADITDNPACP